MVGCKMLFCPKCGAILMPKSDKGKTILSCSCGYKKTGGEAVTIKESNISIEQKKFDVAEDKEILPKTDAECPKCKHPIAYHWEIQTRAADEPPTRFYKCEKCKHTWREYK